MINPIKIKYQQNAYNNVYTNNKHSAPAFSAGLSIKSEAVIERRYRSVEVAGRKILNKIMDYFDKKNTDAIYDKLSKVDEKSPLYIEVLAKAGRYFAKGKEVEINLESGRICEIAKSKEPFIFIMNHDNQSHDPEMMALFNTLLCQDYITLGKAESCPRPKIILNEDILLSMNEKKREIFKKLGAVGIDASVFARGNKNAHALLPVLREFIEGKSNVFIFPEGKMAVFKGDMKEKFQAGVGSMVYRALDLRQQVNVVPLGFAYNNKNKHLLSSIYIGEPIIFKKSGDSVLVNNANMSSSFTSPNYTDFFKKSDSGFSTITEQGNPVTGKEVKDYIAGVLCENLQICKDEAKVRVPEKSLEDKVIDC